MNLALIGLGFIGTAAARLLLAHGETIRVYDVDNERVDALRAAGAVPAASPASAAEGQGLVILALPGPEEVCDVLFGERGVLAAGQPPRVVIDCSTTSVVGAHRAHAACAARGIAFVDAPLSGRLPEAVFFMGGDENAVRSAEPVLEILGGATAHVGPCGTGMVAKLLNQHVLYGSYLLLLEAVAAAEAAGVSVPAFTAALARGPAGSRVLDGLGSKILHADLDENRGAPLRLIAKDLRLRRQLDVDSGAWSATLPPLVEVFEHAEETGLGDKHFGAVLDIVAGRAGVSLADNSYTGCTHDEPASWRSPKELVEGFIQRWNDGTPETLYEVARPDFVWRGIDGTVISGLDRYVQRVQARRSGPRRRIQVERIIAEGDQVAVRLVFFNGRDLEPTLRTHDLFRIEDGWIVEEWSGHS